jgi:hypothetical protein
LSYNKGLDTDILGAIWFSDRRIVIDESLDPEESRSREGRYRFTLAHEGGGHWRLHRHLFAKVPAQVSLFNVLAPPSVVCRSSQANEPAEWQANFYASCARAIGKTKSCSNVRRASTMRLHRRLGLKG